MIPVRVRVRVMFVVVANDVRICSHRRCCPCRYYWFCYIFRSLYRRYGWRAVALCRLLPPKARSTHTPKTEDYRICFYYGLLWLVSPQHLNSRNR